jgi:site-specific DNA recombinase
MAGREMVGDTYAMGRSEAETGRLIEQAGLSALPLRRLFEDAGLAPGLRAVGNGVVQGLIYTRVSSEDQAREGVSLKEQLAACRQYAAGRQMVIAGENQDVMSGKRDDRPQYQALLAEIRRLRGEGKAVAVIVARLDRIGRRIAERVRVWDELQALTVQVHSVREGSEITAFMWNIYAAAAQEEVDRLSARVADAKRHIAAAGWLVGGPEPWGYAWREATKAERKAGSPTKTLEPDPLRAPYVVEAFERVAAGDSLRSVARWVAALPAEVRGQRWVSRSRPDGEPEGEGEGERAGPERVMTFACVRKLVNSPLYAARRPDDPEGKGEPMGHPPLVSADLFDRAQAQLREARRLPRQASGRYLLTGFLRCPNCGGRLRGTPNLVRWSSYRCDAKDRGAGAPDPGCYWQATTRALDALTIAAAADRLGRVLGAETALTPDLKKAWAALREPEGAAADRARARELERVIEKSKRRLLNATRMYVDGDLKKARYDELCAEARAQLDEATAKLAGLMSARPAVPDLPPLEVALARVRSWPEELVQAEPERRRDILAQLILRVVPTRQARGRYTVEVAWTPLGEALGHMADAIDALPAL